MTFTLTKSLEILEKTPCVLSNLLSGLSEAWINGNEGQNTWSAKQVVAHLIVCEETNWLPRAKIMLFDNTNKTLEPISMTSHFDIAVRHTLDTLLHDFQTLRKNGIVELKSYHLKDSDFIKSAFHPEIHEVNLQQLISTWVIHDLTHINQISRVLAKQYKNEVGSFKKYLKLLQ
jgi:hypothetical protein